MVSLETSMSASTSSETVCLSGSSSRATDSVNGDEEVTTANSPVGSEIWMPASAEMLRADRMVRSGLRPSEILSMLFPSIHAPNSGWTDSLAINILSDLLDQPARRSKLPQHNSFDDAINLIRQSRKVIVLSGAGVSVSCGIPDFRSKDGIYSRLRVSFPDLPDPSAMFDMVYFRRNPKPFYEFAHEIYPGNFKPSFAHEFIAELETKKQLLRNYTQNIDTLEKVAGIERVVECHGSFSNATCQNTECKAKFTHQDVREAVMRKEVAYCPRCQSGVIKPDIVFFGESLSETFHRQVADDKTEADLLIVIGSSLKVAPVSLIPFALPPSVPQILINREPLPHYTPDIELLGNCDDILREMALALGGEWQEFIERWDKERPTSSASEDGSKKTMSRRRCIPIEEFKQIVKKCREENEAEEEPESEGPSEKRTRLEDMYTPKFVSVPSLLPPDSFFTVGGYRYVFPGADLHLDLDSGGLCQPSFSKLGGAPSEFDDDEDGEEEEEGDGECKSEGDAQHSQDGMELSNGRQRSRSFSDILDLESRLPAQVIQSILRDLE